MAEIFQTQTSGIAGEISRKMYGRSDLAPLTKNSFKTVENMIVTPQGALLRRPGTRFLGKSSVTSGNHKLIPFVFNSDSSYLLEASDQRFRVIKNRSFVVVDNSIVTNGDFATNITGWTDASTGTGAVSHDTGSGGRMDFTSGATGNAAIAQQALAVTNTGQNYYELTFDITTGDTFTVKLGTTAGASDIKTLSFSSSGTQTLTFEASVSTVHLTFQHDTVSSTDYIDNVVVKENVIISTPFTSAMLPGLSFVTSGQALYFASDSVAPRKLTRTSDTAWTLETFAFSEGPYFDLNDVTYGGRGSGTTLTPSATTGSITVTASADLFVSTDVDRLIRYRPGNTSDWGYMTITAYTSATEVTATVERTLTGTTAATEWQMSAWDDTVGYPAIVHAAEGRLLFANTLTQPNGLWASASGALETFRPDDNYDDNVTAATSFATNLSDASDILWLAATGARVFAGTSDGIISLADIALGINNITAQKIDSTRASEVYPVRAQGAAVFTTKDRETLQEMSYIFENSEEGYRAKNLNLWADHLGLDKFKELAYQNYPIPVVWAIDDAGDSLKGLTFVRSENIKAWHKHTFGGTDVKIKAIGTIPGSDNVDNLFLVIERTIDSSTVRYIEYIDNVMNENTDKDDVFFVDSGLTYDSTSASTLVGYDHLKGESVDVVADGSIQTGLSINSSGNLTLNTAASTVHVGLSYTAKLQTQKIEGGNPLGSAIGRKTRISNVVIQTFQSNGLEVYYEDETRRDPILFNEGQIFGEGPSLQTDFFPLTVNSGWVRSPSMFLKSTGGLPMNILSISTGLEVATL